MRKFDVIVIGGGPGGYVAAIKAAQLGMDVACIEKRGTLGGTCLNVGCIPSKALLQSSHMLYEAQHHFDDHGIKLKGVEFSLSKAMQRKDDVVSSLTKGIEGLFAKNKVTYIKGHAKLGKTNEITVILNDGNVENLSADNVILATGSESIKIPGITIDEKQIVSSTGALELDSIPEKMVVIGGGYIGIEMASIWSRLGTKVTVIEFGVNIISTMDNDISKGLYKILQKQGIEFKLSTKVLSAIVDKKVVTLEIDENGKADKIKTDIVLVAIGRKPYTENLGLEEIGVKVNERGRLEVNERFETNVKGIYAIGDLINGPMLAHKAEEDAVAAVENIANQHGHVNYETIPGVIYTYPEVAAVGLTEEQLKNKGIEYNVGKFPLMANSRARANGETDGFVKILACKSSDRIMGAHIISPNAGELIQEIVIAMEYKASSEDIARISHGHPGLSEALKEAAMAVYSKPIHI